MDKIPRGLEIRSLVALSCCQHARRGHLLHSPPPLPLLSLHLDVVEVLPSGEAKKGGHGVLLLRSR